MHSFREVCEYFFREVSEYISRKLVHIFTWQLVSEPRNKSREIWGHYGNRGFRMILSLEGHRERDGKNHKHQPETGCWEDETLTTEFRLVSPVSEVLTSQSDLNNCSCSHTHMMYGYQVHHIDIAEALSFPNGVGRHFPEGPNLENKILSRTLDIFIIFAWRFQSRS